MTGAMFERRISGNVLRSAPLAEDDTCVTSLDGAARRAETGTKPPSG